MNEEDPEFEKTLRAINHYYITQVGICTAALSKLRSAELSDKNIIIRAIMCDMPDCGVETEASADDCGVDLWADRAEYVNETSFNLYVTQAEENVLWNAGEKGRKPGRLTGSAAADHGAERRDGHGAGHSAHLPDTAERQTAGDGVSRRVHGRGIVRLQRRADDGGPDGPCDDGTGAAGPAGRGGGDPKPGKLSGGGQGRERSRRPGRDAEQGREAGGRGTDAGAADANGRGARGRAEADSKGGRRKRAAKADGRRAAGGRRSRRNTAEEMKSGVHDRFEPHFSYICIL